MLVLLSHQLLEECRLLLGFMHHDGDGVQSDPVTLGNILEQQLLHNGLMADLQLLRQLQFWPPSTFLPVGLWSLLQPPVAC